MSPDHAVALSNWIWDNVSPSPIDWEHAIQSNDDNTESGHKYVTYLTPLFSPMRFINQAKQIRFLQWLDQAVIAPLLPANHQLVDGLAAALKLEIAKLVKRYSDEATSNPNR
jgi:hypothetical protein